jgi:hypothetical protein
VQSGHGVVLFKMRHGIAGNGARLFMGKNFGLIGLLVSD